MKKIIAITLLTGCLWTGLGNAVLPDARGVDFSLHLQEPGPGHRQAVYEWQVDKATWGLIPSEKCELSGGGEMRLSKKDAPGEAVISRNATAQERELFVKNDKPAQAAYFRTLLPAQAADVKLVSQATDPLPVHKLKNFEVVYSYNLGGQVFMAEYMVSRIGEKEFFTTTTQATAATYNDLYGAFQQLLATAAVVTPDNPPPSGPNAGQFLKKGMLGK